MYDGRWTVAALIQRIDLSAPVHCAAVGDCETGTAKKACANCTCGRAEAEAAGEKAVLTLEMLENPQSACGSVSACARYHNAGLLITEIDRTFCKV